MPRDGAASNSTKDGIDSFKALAPKQQISARELFFDIHVSKDPDFLNLDLLERAKVQAAIMGANSEQERAESGRNILIEEIKKTVRKAREGGKKEIKPEADKLWLLFIVALSFPLGALLLGKISLWVCQGFRP